MRYDPKTNIQRQEIEVNTTLFFHEPLYYGPFCAQLVFSALPIITLTYCPSGRQVQRECVGGLSTRHDKIGYQKLCFSNSQGDKLSLFLLYLDRRAFYLVKWNCNYSGKTYHPCPESACEEKCWRDGQPCWIFSSRLRVCLSLVLILIPLSGLQMTSVFWVILYYPGVDDGNYRLITALLKCYFVKVGNLYKIS